MKVIKSHGLAFGFFVLLIFGCTEHEEGKPTLEKPLSEIFDGMEEPAVIDDPDPVIENPDYDEIFGEAYSFKMLDEVSHGGEITFYGKEVLKAITEQLQQVDPQMKEKFKSVTVDDLVKILDPRIPLDPQLEKVLQKLLESEKLIFHKVAMPEIEGLEELKLAYDENEGFMGKQNAPIEKTIGDNSCAQEVYIMFGSGARSCGLNLNMQLQVIEDNYLRRMFEAGERHEQRNTQILNFGLQKLPLAVEKLRKALSIVKEGSTTEEVEEIRANLGYLAAASAYHLRINFPMWNKYGLILNEWYYYKELELFAEIREKKEAEAGKVYEDCIDWVNELIKEEVNKNCPGDDPVLY